MNLSCLTYDERNNVEHQLIGALLQSDRLRALNIIKQFGQKSELMDRFFNESYWSNIPVLIYQRIGELNLAEAMQAPKLSNGENVFEKMRETAAQGVLEYQTMSDRLRWLINAMDPLLEHVVWLKGTTLSRSLYQQGNHRLSLDFDIVVAEEYKDKVLGRLEADGFWPIWNEPGYCHQYGVGPVGSLTDLNLTPTSDNETCHNLTLKKEGPNPLVDFKLHPLDTGLRMKEARRFFAEAKPVNWAAGKLLAPSTIDHLIISLLHFHKHGFCGWGWLYDIHLLTNKLSETPELWPEFIRRCQLEGIKTSAAKGLEIAKYHLSSSISEDVLQELQTWQSQYLPGSIMRITSTEFVWNCNSLPMLLLNAAVMGDARRKMQVLLMSILPEKQFLSQYYADGKAISWHNYVVFLVLHWLVLLLPAGLIRRTYGKIYWRPYPNEDKSK
jgi:hypothetical protein